MALVPGLSHSVIVKAPGLLPMQYRAKEIREELGISSLILRAWIRKGLPVSRDSRGHLWINGQVLSAWIGKQKSRRRKKAMKPDEAFCLRCRKVVRMVNPKIHGAQGKKALLSGHCPVCRGRINRGIKTDGE